MGQLIYILYVCVAVPILLMLFILDGKNRQMMIFMLIGMTLNLPVAKINTFILHNVVSDNMFYLSSCFAPIVEELSKGLPVIIFFSLAKKVEKSQVVSCGFACGVGFAVFENVVYFCKTILMPGLPFSLSNLLWGCYRGIGAGLMHCLCTSLVALGVVFVRKNKKLFMSGIFAFLIFAMTYHGIFNSLLQSPSLIIEEVALFIPIVTFIPIAVIVSVKRIKTARAQKEKLLTNRA